MKFTLAPKELLALHNALYDKFESHIDLCAEGDVTEASDAVQLRQVYGRLKACILGALTNKAVDPIEAAMEREQSKIDRLSEELENVKREQNEFPKAITLDDFPDDTDVPEYPRRGGARNQQPRKKR